MAVKMKESWLYVVVAQYYNVCGEAMPSNECSSITMWYTQEFSTRSHILRTKTVKDPSTFTFFQISSSNRKPASQSHTKHWTVIQAQIELYLRIPTLPFVSSYNYQLHCDIGSRILSLRICYNSKCCMDRHHGFNLGGQHSIQEISTRQLSQRS